MTASDWPVHSRTALSQVEFGCAELDTVKLDPLERKSCILHFGLVRSLTNGIAGDKTHTRMLQLPDDSGLRSICRAF